MLPRYFFSLSFMVLDVNVGCPKNVFFAKLTWEADLIVEPDSS